MEKPTRPTWQVVLSALFGVLIPLGSLVAAWCIPVPGTIPALALNSPWVFRGLIFVAVPLAFYVLWIVMHSIWTGQLPQKLGIGPVSIERQVAIAKQELAAGGAALEAAVGASTDPAYLAAMARFRLSMARLEALTLNQGGR